uniref:Uncharacterized protein n=1 Tax=Arundo donax TaxID=35708 RepID=A0A0A9F9L5_ARUDO
MLYLPGCYTCISCHFGRSPLLSATLTSMVVVCMLHPAIICSSKALIKRLLAVRSQQYCTI